MFKKLRGTLILLAMATAFLGAATAQDYPVRPIQITMQYSAGSGPDVMLRKLVEPLSKNWGQQPVVVNRPGANGWLAAGDVKRAAPDGYNLLVTDNSSVALQPLLFKNMPFNPIRDFEAIVPLYSTYFFIVVPADSPWKTVADLVDAARKSSGAMTAGSFGVGSINHLGIADFESRTGTKMNLVPYKSMQDLYSDVAGGRIAWAFGTAATVEPYRQSKRLRLLALAGPRRLGSLPDVPTVLESGGPAGFELKTWVAVYGPKGMPAALVNRIQQSFTAALADPGVKDYIAVSGFEPLAGVSKDVGVAMDSDRNHFAKVVKESGITLE